MTNEEYILKWWKKKTVRMLAGELNVKEQAVRDILRKHKISPISESDLKAAFILDNYERMTVKEIAESLNMTNQGVRDICDEWGIKCKPKNKKYKPPKSFWDRIRENGGYDLGISEMKYSL